MTDDSDDRARRLADVTEALRTRLPSTRDGAPLDEAVIAALAAEHALTPDEVRACARAVATLQLCLEPELPPPLDPTVLPDTYEVLGELGRGGMGVVFRARHRALDREIAVKVLRPSEQALADLLRRFEVEAKSLARLRHPHIVAVHDVGRSGGHVYYTMDLIDGTSLDKVLRAGPLSPSRAVRLLVQVTSAIEHSHEHGVIHRDLKPANILLDRSDEAFVADFGLARDTNVRVELTTTGQILGTPAYMSPESMRGDTALVGERSDVWALGAVLYECLSGVSPFHRGNLADTMHAVLREEPVPLRRNQPRVPRDLALVCAKALAKNPDERYATARALREDLERFQQGRPVLAQRPNLRRRTLRFVQRNRAGVLGAATAASAVAALMTLTRPQPASPEVIDAMIRTAAEREQHGDFAEAATLYDHARGVLGSDARRPLRHQDGSTSDALVDQIWRGILQCRVELAWQRVAAGEAEPAAREVAAWLERCPVPTASPWRAPFVGELVALQTVAGQPNQAAASLAAAARPETAWRTVVHRLRDVWGDPAHRRWRQAGRLLADAFALVRAGTLGSAQLDTFDATSALAAAWAAAPDLDPPTRDAVRAALRAHALGTATPLQWGGPAPANVRALAAVASDTTLPAATRREALDLLCAVSDLPWRPGARDEPDRGTEALGLALRCADATPEQAMRLRLDFALGCWRERQPEARVVPGSWLAAHTGVDPGTDFAAFLDAHRNDAQRDDAQRDDQPATWLANALGPAATATGSLAERFAHLEGPARAWLHQWLSLTRAPGTRVPVWPSGDPEPDNLVASWHHGVRRREERIQLLFGFDALDPSGRRLESGGTDGTWLTLDQAKQTWFGSDLFMGDATPWAALRTRTPRLTLRLPGATDVGGRTDNPFRRVDLAAQVALAERLQLLWGARVSNPPAFARDSGSRAVPLDDLGVWFVDEWRGGHTDERAGCIVLAVRARRLAAANAPPTDTSTLLDWRAEVARQVHAAQRAVTGDATRQGVIEALALLPTDRQAPIDLVARLPWPNLLPALRSLDATCRRLRADGDALADLEARHRLFEREHGGAMARGLLARMLAGRLLCGDATTLTEPDFAVRLDEAVAGLDLGAGYWFRVLCASRPDADPTDALGALARARLAALEVPPALLRALTPDLLGAAPPAALRAALDAEQRERQGTRLRFAVLYSTLLASLLLAVGFGTAIHVRRRAGGPVRAALVCALLGLALFVGEARYGVWRLPPATAGLAGLAVGAWLLARRRRGTVARAATATAALATAAGLAADLDSHAYASGCASVLTTLALALLPLQVGRVLRRWRALAWLAALLLGAAAVFSAIVGLQALADPSAFASFEQAVAASRLAHALRASALVGCGALAVLLMVALVAPGPVADLPDRSDASRQPRPSTPGAMAGDLPAG